ncbi:subtilisin family serine protease [Allocatelliglobosispora scoriae]|uniref:Subtilisin family serine protease n=1 Tax=Allocatelliglobosispora scoriae TaxID=643052 RepID=A0A841BSS3_9ACTN|nr:S8 family serine peptidase [Allocatelliglobosispora scoriae]MBB5869840.1 subtilisin family serine protease [Allocatelliglobosispora scoriae]
MRPTRWLGAAFAVALVTPLASATLVSPSSAAPSATPFKANKVAATSRYTGDKTPSSRLAQTDPSLLGRSDSTSVAIVVKLDVDSVATYAGGISGYAATSPTVTGRKLSGDTAEKKYEGYLAQKEDAFIKALTKQVPNAKVSQRLRTVYGGVATVVPANKIADLLKIPGVTAIQKDDVRKPLTDSSSSFIGADTLYPVLGGKSNAGKGVIVGIIDSGAWPEHPSFKDLGNLSTPPAKADGTPRTCDFGDNPLTPAADVFVCGKKLIGGAAFLNTYNIINPPDMYGTTARDSNGHGTHTASTSAGNVLATAPVFGVERGPLNGIAPGAWVSVYKALGANGGYASDLTAAVQQAVKDGVSVINYSISGGSNPYTDSTELAFLDAYAAGVFVSASAGNSGPGAATTDHVSPWVTTVAASTQTREFLSTLTLNSGADSLVLTGASITAGAGPLPVVLSSAAPYSNNLCNAPAAPGIFAGKIVACQRGGNGRVEKGFNVKQGGAAGMILYNPTLADTETDNHWVPTVHLADGTAFKAFATAHPSFTASFTAGVKHNGQADVMASFSSRGPGGFGIKPDITGPGVQILAGLTPTPEDNTSGPSGEYFQAIAGTSMSAPHITGSAALLKALHPTWTPGQIKSALMTTAKQSVVKEDTVTPADPFDYGSGRVDLTVADDPGLTFDESAARMFALGNDPLNAVNLNLPSVNIPVLPGRVATVRTAKNVTTKSQTYKVTTTAPANSKITVSPTSFTLAPGASVALKITVSSTATTGQYFGEIKLTPSRAGLPKLHLPVAFVPKQGSVSLAQDCAPASVAWLGQATCTVTATNNSFGDATADLKTTVDANLLVTGATGATVQNPWTVKKSNVALAGATAGVPSIAPGVTPAGYLPLQLFGIAPDPIGDEDIVNYTVPSFVFNGKSYDTIGIDSNGYAVVGGGTAEDNNCCSLTTIPDTARPNNVLAPFWTDLTGDGADGIRAATLTDGVNTWLVLQWDVNVCCGATDARTFQIWIGTNGVQDISFTYDPSNLPADPSGYPFLVGAENENGGGGAQLPAGVLPTEDLVVTSTDPTPGASVSYTVKLRGILPGAGTVTSEMVASTVPGVTVVNSGIVVRRPQPTDC